jgi:uncharacterized protein YggE
MTSPALKIAFSVFFLFSFGSIAKAEVALISVVGHAEKSVDPNEVSVSFEIWAKSPQAKLAQEVVAKEYQRIKLVKERFKIRKEDFQTVSYNLTPEYNYNQNQTRLAGYRASHNLQATLRKVDEAGAFLDSLVGGGKSEASISLQSVAWGYDKRDEVETSLLAQAVRDAKAQADELAKASHSKIKAVFRISRDSRSETPAPFPNHKMMLTSEASSALPSEVAAGPIKIQSWVQVQYEIIPQ